MYLNMKVYMLSLPITENLLGNLEVELKIVMRRFMESADAIYL